MATVGHQKNVQCDKSRCLPPTTHPSISQPTMHAFGLGYGTPQPQWRNPHPAGTVRSHACPRPAAKGHACRCDPSRIVIMHAGMYATRLSRHREHGNARAPRRPWWQSAAHSGGALGSSCVGASARHTAMRQYVCRSRTPDPHSAMAAPPHNGIRRTTAAKAGAGRAGAHCFLRRQRRTASRALLRKLPQRHAMPHVHQPGRSSLGPRFRPPGRRSHILHKEPQQQLHEVPCVRHELERCVRCHQRLQQRRRRLRRRRRGGRGQGAAGEVHHQRLLSLVALQNPCKRRLSTDTTPCPHPPNLPSCHSCCGGFSDHALPNSPSCNLAR